MFNKKIAFLYFLILPFLGFTQGVEFEHISLEEALAKAKKENKLVFIDFYTVWCGPCKKMAKIIFPLPEVGDVYNKNFINLKLDAEKEGEAVAKQYNVTGYPTLLYLDTDGNVLLKDTAFKPEEIFLNMAQMAITSLDSAYSLENLQKEFPNKFNDEHFLKMYIEKMAEYGQDTVEGIDAWLKVQTEMDDASPEMMKYLIKNSQLFIIGGKAKQILDENFDFYMKNASEYEAKMLSRLSSQIVVNTKRIGLRHKNPEVLKLYIDYCKQPENNVDSSDLMEAELTYYALIENDESYKNLTVTYVSKLINDKSIAEIHEADKKSYELYKRAYEKDPVSARLPMLNASKEGLKAYKILKEINEKGKGYLERITSKKEYKTLINWIEYGYELKPENCFMDDLKAELYYKTGKNKKAVELKERAIKNWPKTDKKFINKEYELEQMRNGEEI